MYSVVSPCTYFCTSNQGSSPRLPRIADIAQFCINILRILCVQCGLSLYLFWHQISGILTTLAPDCWGRILAPDCIGLDPYLTRAISSTPVQARKLLLWFLCSSKHYACFRKTLLIRLCVSLAIIGFQDPLFDRSLCALCAQRFNVAGLPDSSSDDDSWLARP